MGCGYCSKTSWCASPAGVGIGFSNLSLHLVAANRIHSQPSFTLPVIEQHLTSYRRPRDYPSRARCGPRSLIDSFLTPQKGRLFLERKVTLKRCGDGWPGLLEARRAMDFCALGM